MKISQAISLMNIKNVPFKSQRSGIKRKKGMLAIYATKQGVYYWNEESIWSIGIKQDTEDELYQIKQMLKQNDKKLNGNNRELDKYVAVFEILHAVNEYRGVNDTIPFETIKRYVEILNKGIFASLDFHEISGMEILKKLIMENKLYSQMLFTVCEIRSTKKEEYLGYKKEKRYYCFGNIKYHEELDKVHITIYDDYVQISCNKEIHDRYEQKLDIGKNFTLEQKIILALDCWSGYYLS